MHQLNVSDYLDISMMCDVLGDSDTSCRAGAINAGVMMFLGMSICLALAVAIGRSFDSVHVRVLDEQTAFAWILLAIFVVFAAHTIWSAMSDVQLSRIGTITQQSNFFSLENLIWPLLLQLMNSSKTIKYKFLYFALLLPIVSLSPYRGVLFAVLLFGFALPIFAMLASSGVVKPPRRSFMWGGAALLVVALLLFSIYSDTNGRNPEKAQGHIQKQTQHKLEQRLTYPLFQAYLAERVAVYEPLPTVWDEILIKLRLGHGQNLNEYLYGKIYGVGSSGETTSLYYGEASANGMSAPLLWIVVGPLLLVFIWLYMRYLGYEVGTLVSIAIWRGSLGGVATVIPALIIQIIAVVAVSRHRESIR